RVPGHRSGILTGGYYDKGNICVKAQIRSFRTFFPKIPDGLDDPLLEGHLRLPSEPLAGARDVGLADLRIVLRERLVDDGPGAGDDLPDPLSELQDGHLARVAEVDRLVESALRETVDPVDQVADV